MLPFTRPNKVAGPFPGPALERATCAKLPLIGVLYRPVFKIFLLVGLNVGLDMHMQKSSHLRYGPVLCERVNTIKKWRVRGL
jgi:hypothetical protein